jgi:alkylation response protein AidB-like acyl-CoA dehydrogenase
VDFELSDDQQALQSAAADVLGSLATSARVRATFASGDPFDADLWRAMVDQGWLGVDVPEELGGLGLGTVEAAVLLEQSGRVNAPVPLLDGLVALATLTRALQSGVGDARAWIERLLTGDAIACVAWPAAGPAPYAPCADLVVRQAGDELVAVPLEGRRPLREPAMDLTRPLGWLELDGAPSMRLGGGDAVAALLDYGATAYAAELLGGASRAMELSVEYAKERVQFGRPIGSFQAIKHRCADMLVDVEGMRSSVYWAAWCIGAGHEDASVAASTAKVWCSDASRRVMASALQVHGGIGFTWEHDVHLFLKRAQLDQTSFGDAGFHRDRLVDLLRARVEAGGSLL